MTGILNRIKKIIYGDLTFEELKQFAMLAVTFFFIIGSYWLLRPLKDGVFTAFVGSSYLPKVKILSLFILLPIILIYSKLVDLVEKQKLFYIIPTAYAVLFAIVAILLKHPTIGLANTQPSKYRYLGWLFYVSVESFGSTMPALFWSFVASNTTTESAKRGYGFIIFVAQMGSMLGGYLAMQAPVYGLPALTWSIVGTLLVIPFLIKAFITVYPSTAEPATVIHKPKTSPVEGIRLLFTKPYLLGVLGVSTLYEVVATILELQMKIIGKATFPVAEDFTAFMGRFALTTNFITFIFALVGTSFFIRTFGLSFCLTMFPIISATIIFSVWQINSLSLAGSIEASTVLWVMFAGMATYKAVSYALNNPCKEILYIPTSKDVKFKAKSCIDMFGSRSAKASGASIVDQIIATTNAVAYGSLISFGVIAVWLSAALYVGRTNKKLVSEGRIIE